MLERGVEPAAAGVPDGPELLHELGVQFVAMTRASHQQAERRLFERQAIRDTRLRQAIHPLNSQNMNIVAHMTAGVKAGDSSLARCERSEYSLAAGFVAGYTGAGDAQAQTG